MFTILKSIITDDNQLKTVALAENTPQFMETFTKHYNLILKNRAQDYLTIKDRMEDIKAIIRYEEALLNEYVDSDEYDYVKEEFLSYKKELIAEYNQYCIEGLVALKNSLYYNKVTLEEFKQNIKYFHKS